MSKRVAIYVRVSTEGQTTENQRRQLEQVAERSGWTIVEVYEDHGISGAKGRDQRPEFDRLCRDASRRHLDIVAAWSVCRLGPKHRAKWWEGHEHLRRLWHGFARRLQAHH